MQGVYQQNLLGGLYALCARHFLFAHFEAQKIALRPIAERSESPNIGLFHAKHEWFYQHVRLIIAVCRNKQHFDREKIT